MSYKIALTSSGALAIDLHFGHTRRFDILEVNENSGEWKALEERSLQPEDPQACSPGGAFCGGGGCGAGQGHQDDRLQLVIKTLSDCAYILTAKIGPRPQAVLKQAGITALESPPGIERAVQQLNAYHQRIKKKGVHV
jgi:predicted Fe-Mo cluster-binding NifX family protein